MLKPHPACNVCKAIETHPKLLKEIFESKYYIKTSGRTLLDITKDYPGLFSYDSIRSHARKHQWYTPKELKDKNTRAIRKKADQRAAIKKITSGVVWDSVIGEGMRRLADGELEMKTADLLKAAKDKSDYELKVKDQELAMAEMVAFFASGESDAIERNKYDRRIIEGSKVEDYDPTLQPAADSNRRENQSRSFYQSLAGDAAAPGTD